MTEEVVKLIYDIRDGIEEQKKNHKNALATLQSSTEEWIESYNKKCSDYDGLHSRYDILLGEFNTAKTEAEDLQCRLADKDTYIENFKAKTLGTVKRLVEKIEEQEDYIKSHEGYISIEEHNKEIKALSEEKEKIAAEKQTALENTWSEQHKLSADLEEKNIEVQRLTGQLNAITQEMDTLKAKNIEVERLEASIKELTIIKEDLEKKNTELAASLNRIYNKEASEEPQRVITNVPQEQKQESKVVKGTENFNFGITSRTVIDKLIDFINEIYKNAIKSDDGSFYILPNLRQAKEKVSLTDHEYEVFISRLQEMEGPNGMPLLVIVENKARTYFEKGWMIQYVSSIA